MPAAPELLVCDVRRGERLIPKLVDDGVEMSVGRIEAREARKGCLSTGYRPSTNKLSEFESIELPEVVGAAGCGRLRSSVRMFGRGGHKN